MNGKIVDRILEKVPFSSEIREAIAENLDLTFTKQLASEIVRQFADQSGRLKKEFFSKLSEEVGKELDKIDKKELLKSTLEEMEITISFKRKD
jgi:ribosome maturation factor RimP